MPLLSRSKEKLTRELPPDACVLAARFPLATWTETRHDVHTVKSRGYNVNQLWEYELDPDLNSARASRILHGLAACKDTSKPIFAFQPRRKRVSRLHIQRKTRWASMLTPGHRFRTAGTSSAHF